ncbi:hypothetical protein [Devosia neptuniae]|jgi:hypothetical protein|uniref:hypothetical protein n=1 Tax=Devosia TaxID=46913 RepID=UPI0022AF657E|nr:hypothetical protein [Devosia neptuniae]MCZ4345589.1 hypothetical protein [Devosia neptuniae]|tara:strand:+ start:39092 stop:39991 length:900 start_codon:yes stop_codon:yes gene_type:complete
MPIINPLCLNEDRTVRSGSTEALAAAIGRGGDLRVATRFRHNEHIDTGSDCDELIDEVAEFRQTLLLDQRWSAGIMTLRMPVELPDGFGPRPSMSFFLYNQDGQQAVARPFLDGQRATGQRGPAPLDDHSAMPRYHQLDGWDGDTNAPSSNFIYAFDSYSFLVNDRWQEVLAHSAEGDVVSGALADLVDGFKRGLPIKLAISGLCDDLSDTEYPLAHEVFVHAGSTYYYGDRKLLLTGTHPVVRVRPDTPLRYSSAAWDCGWLVARTDGQVERWLCDPYTLKFNRSRTRHAIRWFVAAQ